MASLISCATGNFTAAGTWALVDATSMQDNETANRGINTTYINSATFIPGAITIDAIAFKIASTSGSPTGTITAALDQGGADVAGTVVTVNSSDLPAAGITTTTNEGGWFLFKFAAPVLLLAATAYSVKIKASNSLQANLWCANTSDLNRMLRTTTTQAPAANDILHVIPEYTGAGTSNTFTVTMDNTATTTFGSGTNGTVAISVGKGCTLAYGTTAATNYYLKLGGIIIIYTGGTFNIGTSGSEIPRDSTAVLEFLPTSNGGMGISARNGSTVNMYGLSRTSGKNVNKCLLTADKAAASTTFSVDTDTGWLNGDVVFITKTERSGSSKTETLTLSGGAGASSFTTTAGSVNAHLGTAPIQACVGLLTRNVKVRGVTNGAYINIKGTSTFTASWVEFSIIGHTVAGTRGLEIETTTGATSITYCSIYSTTSQTLYLTGAAHNNITIDNNTGYGLGPTGSSVDTFTFSATTGTSNYFRNNLFALFRANGGNGVGIKILDLGWTFTGNKFLDCSNGVIMWLAPASEAVTGDYSNNEISYSISYGVVVGSAIITSGVISSWTGVRNQTGFIGFNVQISNGNFTPCIGGEFDDFVSYGNGSTEIAFAGSVVNWTFKRLITSGDTTNASTNAINFSTNSVCSSIIFDTCTLGRLTSIFVNHTNIFTVGTSPVVTALFTNCLFGVTNITTTKSELSAGSLVRFEKYGQTANDHRAVTKYGILTSTGTGLTDTTVRTASSLGVRIAPEDATTGYVWSFNILAKASSIVSFFGYFQKNAAFSTNVCKVELWLPGSTAADDTFTLADNTNWQAGVVSANYTGTVDLLATVKVYAISSTAAAYLYCDDFYNAGTSNKIAGLDTWEKGLPVTFLVDTVFDPSSVWSYDTTNLTVAGTTGNQVKKLLTVPLFLGLK